MSLLQATFLRGASALSNRKAENPVLVPSWSSCRTTSWTHAAGGTACPRRVAETCRSALPAATQAPPALITKHVLSSVALFSPETSILIQNVYFSSALHWKSKVRNAWGQ